MRIGGRWWPRVATVGALAIAVLVGVSQSIGLAGGGNPDDHAFTRAPSAGIAPLWVRFQVPGASVADPNTTYSLDFGDGTSTVLSRSDMMHRYAYVGETKSYTVALTIRKTEIGEHGWQTSEEVDTWAACVTVTNPTSPVATVYWCNQGDNTIRMCNSTDLTLGESTVIAEYPDVLVPSGLYISEAEGDYLAGTWVTWANTGDNTIRAMEIGAARGSSYILADEETSQVNAPRAVQIVDDRLFWTNSGDRTIRRLNLSADGPQPSTPIVEAPFAVYYPYGLHVVETQGPGRFVYYTAGCEIFRCHIDGSTQFPVTASVEICYVPGSAASNTLPLDVRVSGPYVYWASGLGIHRCSVADGTTFPARVETVVPFWQIEEPGGFCITRDGAGAAWSFSFTDEIWTCTLPCSAPAKAGDKSSSGIDHPTSMRYTAWDPNNP